MVHVQVITVHDEQIRRAFFNAWFDEKKTYNGAADAFYWWIDPRRKCMIQQAGRQRCVAGRYAWPEKCLRQCEFCAKLTQ